jgi:hypothetical protein
MQQLYINGESALACSSAAADEVHDDGDDSEDEQEVNEKAADVQDEEATEPKDNQHHRQN